MNTEMLLLIETLPKKEVIFESLSSLSFMSLLDMRLKSVGSKVNVIINDVISPKVIIQPKSIMGLMPLKTKDKKAHMVVRTVQKIGQNIFPVVIEITLKLAMSGKSLQKKKKRVLM